jgi:hypothetical protein
MNNTAYLLSWDNTGLESVIEVDYDRLDFLEQERVAKVLADPNGKDPGNRYKSELSRTLSAMKLRARSNHQRHYEIYMVPVSDGVTEQNVRDLFESSPQAAADLMRERGTQLYSDRANQNSIVIT